MTTPHDIHVLPDTALSVWQPPRLRAVAKYRPGTGMPESIEIELNDPVNEEVVRSVVSALLVPPGQTRPAGEVVIETHNPAMHGAPYNPALNTIAYQQARQQQSYGRRA